MSFSVHVQPYRLNLTQPLRLGEFTVSERTGWLLRVQSGSFGEGWGDVAPLPGFSRETSDEVEQALEALPARVRLWSEDALASGEMALIGFPASVVCGLEMALYQLGRPDLMPGPLSGLIPWMNTLELSGLFNDDENEEDALQALMASGYRTVKIKVARRPVSEDIERVRRLAGRLGPDVCLRLDANRGWSYDEARRAVDAWRDLNVDYVEEPIRETDRLVGWIRESGFPTALDERLMEMVPGELNAYAGLAAVVLKPTILGGLVKAKNWVEAAREIGAKTVISASYESGIGILSLARFAMALTGSVPAGLDTYRFLADDVVTPRLPLPKAKLNLDELNLDRYLVVG